MKKHAVRFQEILRWKISPFKGELAKTFFPTVK
jgi:hypothetical protein